MYMCLIFIKIYFERVTIPNSETVPKKCGLNIIFHKQVYSHNLTQFNLDFVNDVKSVTFISSSWKGKSQQESFLVIRTNAKSITYFGCRKTQKRWLLGLLVYCRHGKIDASCAEDSPFHWMFFLKWYIKSHSASGSDRWILNQQQCLKGRKTGRQWSSLSYGLFMVYLGCGNVFLNSTAVILFQDCTYKRLCSNLLFNLSLFCWWWNRRTPHT